MHWLEAFLLPPACQLCGCAAQQDELCHSCAQKAHPIITACPLCALPNDDNSICASCSQQPPAWQQAHSAFIYDGSLTQLMRRWKYGQQNSTERLLCDALADWLTLVDYQSRATAIIAMPMHPSKLAKRGFNTAYQLAKVAQHHLQLPILQQALTRTYITDSQAGLDKAARQQNLQGSFRVNTDTLQQHTHILLIDDVFTTGSTAQACCQILAPAGVKHIELLTLARALPKSDSDSD